MTSSTNFFIGSQSLMSHAAVVYPHQLFPNNPVTLDLDKIYLLEDPLFFRQYAFHRQKLMLHRASMRRYADEMRRNGKSVRYVEANELTHSSDIAQILRNEGIQQVRMVDVEDDYLSRRIQRGCSKSSIDVKLIPHPHFLTEERDWIAFAGSKKKLFFTQFYIEQRKRLKCLIQADGSPDGGKWSFDPENRRKLPKEHPIPKVNLAFEDAYASEARTYVSQKFSHVLGDNQPLLYPTSRENALLWLRTFIEERLPSFGDFEDAIVADESFLFHACLTPTLNIGLISPNDVISAALTCKDRVPMNSMEGFIRQIIGWREFVRVVYRAKGAAQRTCNYWHHTRKIPVTFYRGTTGIEPLDTVIRRVLETGYCHHIERLMVLGNFMLLCEFDPDEVYRWFMELFVDAYDWVMVPNVYGMSQHADGGIMTTKPYISASSYILRMSNFQRGAWCEIWDGLYWSFLVKHRGFFEKNPRMSFMTKQLDRMGNRLADHQKAAQRFLNSLHDELPDDRE